MKKKNIITIAIIVVVVLAIYLWFKSGFNNMVQKQEAVTAQWAQVENVYQRRADLIPNIVETVKGYAEHEQSTFEAVVEARAKATSLTIDPSNITPEQMKEYMEAQDQLSGALSKLIALRESYPDLKASEEFTALITELEGSENRIAVERRGFNEKAKEYNQYIKMFPRNIIAGMFNFEQVEYFKAQEGADKAPKVDFSK